MKLPKLGWVRFRWTRALDGSVRHATVTRDAIGWHLSLCVQLDAQPPAPCGGPAVGVDRGVCALVATSDGELMTGRFWSAGERRRHRALQQKLARQQRGSARRRETVERIARLRARVVRRRRDALHKVSHRLATEHRLVAVESLDVRAMTRSARGSIEQPGRNVRAKAALNREVLERGWGELHRQLQYKCQWHGSQLVAVDPRYTSQTCSVCGTVDGRSRESQARYACRQCGHVEHADINAARVILARALTAGGSPVTARGGLAGGRPVKREPPVWEAA